MNPRFIKAFIRPLLPKQLRVYYYDWSVRKLGSKNIDVAFSEVYKNNLWGGTQGEYFSGDGSSDPSVEQYVAIVKEFIERNSIARIIDLGCGDFRVGQKLISPELKYIGVDVVSDLIEYNQTNYGRDNVSFECLNIISDKLPDAQLCLIRQVLQHLSNAEIMNLLTNIRKYKYVIITEHVPSERHLKIANTDMPHGPSNRLSKGSGVFLDKPPFNMRISKILINRKVQKYSLNPDELLITYLIEN